MGFDTIRDFALTVSIRSFLSTRVRIDILRRLWRYSLACALICEELSANCLSPHGPDGRFDGKTSKPSPSANRTATFTRSASSNAVRLGGSW
jgi:hypothetical protein